MRRQQINKDLMGEFLSRPDFFPFRIASTDSLAWIAYFRLLNNFEPYHDFDLTKVDKPKGLHPKKGRRNRIQSLSDISIGQNVASMLNIT